MNTEWTDGRITVRKLRPGDERGIFEAVRESLAEISVWADWAHPDYALQESAKWVDLCIKLWDMKKEYHFCIEENASGLIIGGCGFNGIDTRNRVTNLGYWVRTGSTGQGVATTAVRLLTLLSFNELNMERIEFTIHPENRASRRVAEKAGAGYEATIRNRIRYHNRQHDAMLFSIIKDDKPFQPLKQLE